MIKKLTEIFRQCRAEQAGQALVLILIFFLLGSLTLAPVLAHMGTALKTGTRYEMKTNELFAADAGVEAGLWRVKYDFMGPTYDPYDFDTPWPYDTGNVNGQAAKVMVKNVWFPSNVTLGDLNLDAAKARVLIESEKLIISGTSGAVPGQPFHIKMEFRPDSGDNLTIKSVGVWLPQGFTYQEGSSDLEKTNPFAPSHPERVENKIVPGGRVVVWHYDDDLIYPLISDLPNFTSVNGTMTATFGFDYNPPPDALTRMPLAVAWVTCEMHDAYGNVDNPKAVEHVPIAWDTDMRYYKITSSSGNTNIVTYSSKSQLRSLGNAIAGDYVAIGNSLIADANGDHIRETKHDPDNYTLTKNPADADVISAYLYWAGWRNDDAKNNIFTDSCINLNNWNYASPTDWSAISSKFNGRYSNGTTDAKRLTLKNSYNLSGYLPNTTIIAWEQSIFTFTDSSADTSLWSKSSSSAWGTSGGAWRARSSTAAGDPARFLTLAYPIDLSYTTAGTVMLSFDISKTLNIAGTDGLDFAFSTDNGSTWQANIQAFRDDVTDDPLHYSYAIPTSNMTSTFKMRFQLVGFTGSGGNPYCTIDNIAITPPAYSSSDGLDFAYSTNNGTTWSDNIQAFRGNIGSATTFYDYNIPTADSTCAAFKFRLQVVGMSGPGQKLFLDNIKIVNLPPDTSITFKINDQQVYLNASGNATAGAQPLLSTRSYAKANYLFGATEGFSYMSMRDVTKLVKTFPVVQGEKHHTGNAKYTVGDVTVDTGSHFTYAGWSLIIIYGSPKTAGHYLYLWDENFSYHPGTGGNLDWDKDGQPGGDITGFLFPEPIKDKNGVVTDNVSAKLTCFVVEGDQWLSPDSVQVKGSTSNVTKELSNSTSSATNAWDGLWPHEDMQGSDKVYEGIDIDTYQIPWADDILRSKDTRLTINLNSSQDSFNLVYLIMSVRSETVTSGTGYYTIGSE